LSELDFSCILKPDVLAVLERWIIQDNEEEFTSRTFFTLREMYTQIRAKSNFNTTTRDHYVDAPKFVNQMPPRLDLFEKS